MNEKKYQYLEQYVNDLQQQIKNRRDLFEIWNKVNDISIAIVKELSAEKDVLTSVAKDTNDTPINLNKDSSIFVEIPNQTSIIIEKPTHTTPSIKPNVEQTPLPKINSIPQEKNVLFKTIDTQTAQQSLNETIAPQQNDVNDKIIKYTKSIKDLMSINDQFLYQAELFQQNNQRFLQFITAIDNCNNFEAAKNVLIQYVFNIDELERQENEAAVLLVNLLKQKF